MAASVRQHGVLGIGSTALRTMRTALMQDLGDDAGATRLQEAGYAAGEGVYHDFCSWVETKTDVSDPGALDATRLTDVLSAYFEQLGWGSVAIERTGAKGLTVVSTDWAEADPAANLPGPSCYFSTGLLASFFTALAGGNAMAVMELQCRGQGDPHCEFLAGAPETLTAVYDALMEERDYRDVLGA